MMDFHTLSVQRRELRAAIRRARRAQGLSHQEAADQIGWSSSKIIRMETGVGNAPQPSDVLALLTSYGVERERSDQLFELARTIRNNHANESRNRLAEIHSPAYMSYLEFEQAATNMKEWQTNFFPGLTQTEEYTTEILINVFGNSKEDAARRIETRIDRQQLVEDGNGPQFHFVIDESVLARRVGSVKVMIAQLERLLEVSALDRAMIQLLPFDSGPNPGMRGSFTLLEFEEDGDDDVVYMETPRGDFFSRDEKSTTSEYQVIFSRLESLALKESEFERRVKQIIGTLQKA
jgi:transcriptional regulator with XRE-family HTH domain